MFAPMILWIIAISLFAVLGLIGYYQGAIRVAFSFAGIVAAAALAFPLAGIVKSVLPAFGLSHPVLLAFLAPVIIYLLVLIGFKSAALAAHKSVTTHYKYKTSDTQRLLWSRLNERLGICLGMANAAAYLVLLGIVFYVLGYCTIQVATSDKDSWMIKAVNTVNQDMKATGFDKMVAPLTAARGRRPVARPQRRRRTASRSARAGRRRGARRAPACTRPAMGRRSR